jgi:Flp pilus assembly protein TadG
MKAHRRRSRGDAGAAAVELAIVLPLLILLVFGIIEFSLLWHQSQGLQASAREGARVAALPQNTVSEITARVRDALSGTVANSSSVAQPTVVVRRPNGTTVTFTNSNDRPCNLQPAGSEVIVTVSYDSSLNIPLWKSATKTLKGKGDFKCE